MSHVVMLPAAAALKRITTVLLALTFSGQVLAQEVVSNGIPGVVAANTRIELLKEGLKGTEGPLAWSDGGLLFTENQAGRIVRIAPDGIFSTFAEQTNSSNALALSAKGDLISVQTGEPRVGVIHPQGHQKTLAEGFEGAPFGRPNDLVVDKRGGVYFTDSGVNPGQAAAASGKTPARPAVYYITPNGALKRIAHDIERPNGIQLSPDEKVLYVANTLGEHVIAFDIGADGVVSNQRNFARLSGWTRGDNGNFSSGADGLAVDGDGRLYVASNAGVEVFNARGEALGIIALPKKPQNLAFAGQDKKSLYVVGRGSVYRIAALASGYSGRAK